MASHPSRLTELADGRIDRLAIWLSGLCVVHCVGSAILLGLLASAGGVLASPVVHEVGLVLAILLGVIGLGRGILLHGRRLPLTLGAIGLATMASALALPHGLPETVATIAGVALLALGHRLNRRAF